MMRSTSSRAVASGCYTFVALALLAVLGGTQAVYDAHEYLVIDASETSKTDDHIDHTVSCASERPYQ